jgi:hypothetical protein
MTLAKIYSRVNTRTEARIRELEANAEYYKSIDDKETARFFQERIKMYQKQLKK